MKKLLLSILCIVALFTGNTYAQCKDSVKVTGKAVTCNGLMDGEAVAYPAGGTAPYAYDWSTSPAQSTKIATNLGGGTYTVTILDAKGCSATRSVTIADPAAVTVTGTVKNASCFGSKNGSINALVKGGTTPYTYSWSTTPTQTGKTATGLAAGIYSLTVTDKNGCSAQLFDTVKQPNIIVLSTSSTASSCNTATGIAVVTVTSGGTAPFSYSWNTATAQTKDTINPAAAGQYIVTVTDANTCKSTATVTVGNSSGLSVAIASTNVTCYGAGNGTATATASGGKSPYTYSWSNASTSANLTSLTYGTYSVTVTDNSGCITSNSVKILVPAALSSTKLITNPTCFGSTNGSASVTVKGGTTPYTYNWSTSPAQTSSTASTIGAGIYTLTITDAHGCSTISVDTLTQPVELTVVMSEVGTTCYGKATGTATATVTGGTPTYTYAWSTSPAQTTLTATKLSAATYTVTVTDKNACKSISSISVTQPVAISLTPTSGTTGCSGSTGVVSVNATGGTAPFAYAWNNGEKVATDTALAAGTYTVTVTDANKCTSTTTTTVANASGLTASIASVQNVLCNGGTSGSASASVSGGTAPYKYNWSTTPAQTTSTASGLAIGSYSVSVTDNAGCVVIANTKITQPKAITATFTKTNVLCPNGKTGTISLTAAGGTSPYSYSWSAGGTTTLESNLGAGTYTVTITDNNACSVTQTTTLTAPAAFTIGKSNVEISCYGGTNGVAGIGVKGGTTPYTYSWSTNPIQTAATARALTAGIYSVTVTDKNGCTTEVIDTLTQPAAIVPITTSTDATCGDANGTVSISATGGSGTYSYSWSTGSTASSVNTLNSGVYNVTVTDSKGCTATSSSVINNSGGASVSITSSTNLTCANMNTGSIEASATGGKAPYTYSWSSTATPVNTASTSTINGLAAGSYTITVTDANNCPAYSNVTLTSPAAILITLNETGAVCNGGSTGAASASVSGGAPGYSYSWSSNSKSVIATNLKAGTYTLTVTDASSCSATSSIVVTQPNAITGNFTTTDVSCFGGNSGATSVVGSGGTPGYVYSWSTGTMGNSISSLVAGTYTVTITDTNSCTGVQSVTISQPAAIIAKVANVLPSCIGSSDGAVSALVTGGTTPYIYVWSTNPIQTTSTVNGLKSGNYTLTVTDNEGCSATVSDVLAQPAGVSISMVTTNNTNCVSAVGAITARVNGGSSPYTFAWSNLTVGLNDSSLTGLSGGAYNVTVTDNNGCTATATGIVTNSSAGMVSVSTIHTIACYGDSTGSALGSISGGAAPFTYAWSNGTTVSNSSASINLVSNLSAGTYTLTVTDNNSCSSFGTISISSPNALQSSFNSSNALCAGSANGLASADISGGVAPYSYFWSTPTGQGTAVADSLAAGTYTLTVQDANGCELSSSVTIGAPSPLSVTFSQTLVTCNGGSNGRLTAHPQGGTPAYYYSWSTGANTDSIIGLSSLNYTVTITDVNGCKLVDADSVGQNTLIVVTSSSTAATCGSKNGTATVSASGGIAPYIYTWETTPIQTGTNASGLGAGLFTVVVTDAAGCAQVTDVAVSNTSATGVVKVTPTPVSCNGAGNGIASVTETSGNGPFTYAWTTNPVQTTATAKNLGTGTYSVAVTDANGCVLFGSCTITQPNTLDIAYRIEDASCATCSNGYAVALVSGGTSPYTYSWSSAPVQTSDSASGLPSGIYTLCVTDNNGCLACNDSINVATAVSGIAGIAAPALNLNVYPNPSSGSLFVAISLEGKKDMTIRLVNMLGQVLYDEQLMQAGSITQTLNLSEFRDGVYLLQVVTSEGLYTKRVVVQR